MKIILRYIILICSVGLTIYLGTICISNISYYYRTRDIQENGHIIRGWVTNLNEFNYEITFKMQNGDYYKSRYSSDFYQFALNDTLEFKHSSNYPNEYIHINENPSGMFITISYLFLIFVLLLFLTIYFQIRKIITLTSNKS